ncbi:uncharacterized protein N7482_007490 [Penicillium canariense]|uniref:Uncharacterized protein n=1 Tax=Penicillium canariense TaxID=189055 RepID=A0A9W9LKM4_9EURO|nr:uncharacterized protein N7482_007490 [Penicillium canariense]KAJ5160486.1 hypothetical protein N7482_007490 [Penicillium canariense]
MDQEEAPPPYSAVDPLIAPANSRNGSAAPPLQGNVSASQAASSSQPTEQPVTASSPAVVPAHFTSAAAYFEERPPTGLDESRALLHHHMTIYPRSSAKDFPRRPRCWASCMDEVAQRDWDTFLRYLFPPQLGLAAASQHLPRQLRAEIQRDRKDRPQETDEQRQARVAAVVDEWNQCFFEPRAAQIIFVRTAYTITHWLACTSKSAIPSPPSAGPLWAIWRSSISCTWCTSQPPASPILPPPPPPPPGVPPWQWNHWAYSQPQFGNSGTQKSGGTLGWISSLTSQAQKYGERFAEQAQHYGDQISAQAMHYGRQVEEQALMHGRWVEEQTRLHGRKPGAYPSAPYISYQQSTLSHGQPSDVTENTSTPPAQPEIGDQHPNQNPSQNPNPSSNPNPDPVQPQSQSKADQKKPIVDHPRRASISSTSSESSLSSIDSLSTTSDLSPSDLATVRTQLQGLHDRHDRILYDAAVDLRRQLDVLQESRREARASGRRNWRTGWRQQQSNSADSSDWGRWESPQQQERQSMERHAMKEEMRATKKAFRDVVRRARDEQRERKRAKWNRRRQARSQRAGADEKVKEQVSLDGRMGNLSLGNTPNPRPVRTQTELVSKPPQWAVPVRSDASSAPSAQGIRPPSSAPQSSELPGRKAKPQTRFKEMLKPRNAKKQQKPDSDTKNGKDSKKDPGGP